MINLPSKYRSVKTVAGFVVATLCVMLASCDATIHFYPEPDEPDKGRSKIRLNVDWSGYGKTVPTGMTVICHHTESGEMRQSIDNNTSFVTPYLAPGRHWAMVFNLTEDEFGCIRFRGLESAETAEAYLPELNGSKWYEKRDGSRDYMAGQPEWLAVDTIMTDPVEPFFGTETKVIGTLHPRNIIYTLHVTVWTENIGNVKMVRGAISGMASGRRFASDRPNDNFVTVTHLIESGSWSRTRTSSDPNDGFVKADIRCFGLPGNHGGRPEENTLEFRAMLADGKTVLKYIIPVGDLIRENEAPPECRGDNLDLYLTVRLDPPVPPVDGDGDGDGDGDWGFDVDVEDWEETDDVIVPLNTLMYE